MVVAVVVSMLVRTLGPPATLRSAADVGAWVGVGRRTDVPTEGTDCGHDTRIGVGGSGMVGGAKGETDGRGPPVVVVAVVLWLPGLSCVWVCAMQGGGQSTLPGPSDLVAVVAVGGGNGREPCSAGVAPCETGGRSEVADVWAAAASGVWSGAESVLGLYYIGIRMHKMTYKMVWRRIWRRVAGCCWRSCDGQGRTAPTVRREGHGGEGCGGGAAQGSRGARGRGGRQ